MGVSGYLGVPPTARKQRQRVPCREVWFWLALQVSPRGNQVGLGAGGGGKGQEEKRGKGPQDDKTFTSQMLKS